MPLGVLTSYKIKENLYASYVLGSNISIIKKSIKKRGLNERIDSKLMNVTNLIPDYSKLSLQQFSNNIHEIIHTACFLSFIALKSKNTTIENVLGDEGVLHILAHSLNNPNNKKSLNKLRDLVQDLQNKSTGIYVPA